MPHHGVPASLLIIDKQLTKLELFASPSNAIAIQGKWWTENHGLRSNGSNKSHSRVRSGVWCDTQWALDHIHTPTSIIEVMQLQPLAT